MVLDHHQSEIKLPSAFSIVNPNKLEDKSGFNQLAAVGVTFCSLQKTSLRICRQKESSSSVSIIFMCILGYMMENRLVIFKMFKQKNNSPNLSG